MEIGTEDYVKIEALTNARFLFLIVRMLIIIVMMAYGIGVVFYIFVEIEETTMLDIKREEEKENSSA